MDKWEQIRRGWLHLDAPVRSQLLGDYPDFFVLIQTASMSSITYFADILSLSELWTAKSLPGLTEALELASPRLKKTVKNLAVMVSHDGKVFADF